MNIMLQEGRSVLAGAFAEAAVADIQTAQPEDDILSDVGGMIGDALEMTSGEYEMEARSNLAGV